MGGPCTLAFKYIEDCLEEEMCKCYSQELPKAQNMKAM